MAVWRGRCPPLLLARMLAHRGLSVRCCSALLALRGMLLHKWAMWATQRLSLKMCKSTGLLALQVLFPMPLLRLVAVEVQSRLSERCALEQSAACR